MTFQTATSDRLFAEARALMPGGVSSPARAFNAVGRTPVFIDRAEGAYLHDVDGNAYVDHVLSFGPMILGHAAPEVTEALREAVGRGTSYGACSPLEIELAREVQAAMPHVERVHRGDDERAPARTRLHWAREGDQVRGALPRPR
jgi:glutamate-1-semialdehyde 2,1-aminomutase